MQTVTSRAFNQNPSAAKKAADKEPVQITERGRVSHVLLSIDQFNELTGVTQNIVDCLAMSDSAEHDFQPLDGRSIKPADFA